MEYRPGCNERRNQKREYENSEQDVQLHENAQHRSRQRQGAVGSIE
jgi:hypothetical protein